MGKINILNDAGTNKLSLEFNGTSDATINGDTLAAVSNNSNADGSASSVNLTTQTIATLPPTANPGTIAYVSDDGGNLYYKNGSAWKSFTAPLGSAANPAPNALAIIQVGDSFGDGLYWIQNSNINGGVAFQVYCDMTKNGGGWILIHTVRGDAVGNMGWNDSLVQLRNTTTPSILNAYSIIGWSDYLKRTDSNWQWMVEATDTYTTRYTWGGVFTANVSSYSMNTTSPSQTNITANEWFNFTRFIENEGVGQRVPWRDTSYLQAGIALYTTYPGAGSWWGTITQNDTNYSSYKTGPWSSSAGFVAPQWKRVWIR